MNQISKQPTCDISETDTELFCFAFEKVDSKLTLSETGGRGASFAYKLAHVSSCSLIRCNTAGEIVHVTRAEI